MIVYHRLRSLSQHASWQTPLYHMNKQKIPNSPFRPLQIFIVALIFVCGISSVSVFAQSWKEPSTQNPSISTNAASVPNLIRVENKRCMKADGTGTFTVCAIVGANCATADETCQNKQAVEGNLRIGSASSSDIFSSLEVYGSMEIQNSVLVDSSVGGTKCTTVECANGTQYPAFLVQQTAGSVGIGTNVLSNGRLNVRAGVINGKSEYPYAVYAVSSGEFGGVWAKSTADPSLKKAGIITSASGQSSIAVFGKAIDVQHRGIFADANKATFPTGTSIAAQFKGNVTVVGGFYQGDGSQLIRVGNVADNGPAVPQTGQIGMSTWVKREVSIASGTQANPTTTTVNFNFPTGQGYIVKYVSVMLGNGTTNVTYTPLYGVPGVTVQVNGTNLAITNKSGNAYTNSIVYAQVQSGVSAAVFEYTSNPGQATEIVSTKPILYTTNNNGSYELSALVTGAPTQSFFWKIENGKGTICASTASCAGTELTSDAHVYYQMPSSYPNNPNDPNDPTDKTTTISVTWSGTGGTVSKTISLQLFDLEIPSVNDRTVEMGDTKSMVIGVNSVYRPTTPNLTFELNTSCPSNDCLQNPISPSTARFKAPITNPLSVVKYTLVARLAMDPTVAKPFDVYVVPQMTITTRFPNNPFNSLTDPQPNVETSTVAVNKELHVAIVAVPGNITSAFACTPPSCTSWSGTDGIFKTSTVDAKTISIVWTPTGADYPPGFTYTKTKIIFSGKAYGAPTSSVGSTVYVRFWTSGYPDTSPYPSPYLEPSPITNTNGNNSTFSDPTKSGVIGGDISSTRILSLTAIRNEIPDWTAVTYNVTPNTTPTPVHVYGRSRADMRDIVNISLDVPSTACYCDGHHPKPSCCITNPTNPN